MRFGQSYGKRSEMTPAADQTLKKPLNSIEVQVNWFTNIEPYLNDA
jgi:hypothetical protein